MCVHRISISRVGGGGGGGGQMHYCVFHTHTFTLKAAHEVVVCDPPLISQPSVHVCMSGGSAHQMYYWKSTAGSLGDDLVNKSSQPLRPTLGCEVPWLMKLCSTGLQMQIKMQ